ncbi:MAG: hypothetical protein QOH58_2907 [Thermoleophilaceae bacterium]|jgi:uncharacterized protein YecE (DUF72 family)|nr:hypothetical protein [Thermoleophilaceae bacterium]
MAGRILVGTSSWADPGFVKEWYPPKMAARERLPWYAERFAYVELNSSFYAVPDRNTVHKWVEDTPDGFVFDVKAHRLLSRHSAPVDSLPPDLRDGAETTERGRVRLTPELEVALAERLVEETAPLAEAGKLGAYLVQLTPAFAPGRHELEELDRLVEALAPHRVAVELRHRGWVRDKRMERTLGWFADRDLAFVSVDAPPGDHVPIMPSELDAVTSDEIAYLRLHGRNTEGYLKGKSVAERFGWRYEDEELDEIAGRAKAMAEQAREVHVAFNNNRGDDAPTAAQRFRALLGQAPAAEEQLRL